MVRDSVRAAFVPFTVPLEGSVRWLYLDTKGLVTIAIGNLVDPVELAVTLPLVHEDGSPASRDEIRAAWARLKSQACGDYRDPRVCVWKGSGRVCLAHAGHLAAEHLTTLRLTPDGVGVVVMRKFDDMATRLRARFPSFPDWPADAQLAILSLAWACGPAFHFPRLEAALRACDWRTAAIECRIADDAGTVKLRNAANRTMLRNAAAVVESVRDPSALYYPEDLTRTPESEAPTEPDLPNPPSEPKIVVDFERVHPKVPLGRPALDG